MRLLLALVSSNTQLAGDQLQLVIQLKPHLQLHRTAQHKHLQQQQLGSKDRTVEEGRSSSTASSSSSSWWGPLLQPCHAECVLWHADISPVTSQSSWQWDAVTGLLTVHAVVPLSLQLTLASQASSSSGAGFQGLSSSWKLLNSGQLPTSTAGSKAAAGSTVDSACGDAYIGAAMAMAAAAAAAAGSDGCALIMELVLCSCMQQWWLLPAAASRQWPKQRTNS
ncbi:hypothetical protein COO60DRAFT_821721 [Scenedesmus sp. NREL 46B-D3]|nr:hypothetical protein COO60DRAFT_821721 [Scenedesmus sp. NREL 46B-D3]